MTAPQSAVARYYLTTPIYYVNDKPHIGHAYTTLACDVLARFLRLDGTKVHFLTGTDEHGQKVEKSAAAAGIEPKAFTDKVSQNFRDLAARMNFTNDDFIRTTEPRHYAACQALWTRLMEKGEIYLGAYEGWYAIRDEAYYAESELIETPTGKKAPTGADVEWVTEPSYFFRLSNWGEKLLEFYEANPDFIAPRSRRNEVLSFVKSGLQDLSVSRTSFSWGVPVPGDDKHIMYVWFDALTNYLSALGYPDETGALYQDFWPPALHMVGKDILRFHAVFWPAFLMAADLPVPGRVFAHGWWTNEGQKISKSLGNVIDPLVLIDTYGLDPVRYFLLREISFGNDGDFSHAQMVKRINTDLANDLGNLAQRVLSMIAKNCGGKVPTPGAFTEADHEMLNAAAALHESVRASFLEQAFHRGLEAIWEVVVAANRYVDQQAPWTLRKTDFARMETVLYVLADVIRQLGLIVQPVMPASGEKLLDQVAIAPEARSFAHYATRLVPGTELPAPQGVFPRWVAEEEGAAS
ncbi:methionine--tRNA ligase [Elstera sp.]|jgi:methionyl-tRNA synthetase|uniref:methionine--tRNA ligase n=1 Tax=Elstera sp. TaxID=1916664 RepID=UPI0037C162A1